MPPDPATPTVWTVRALIQWTTQFLTSKGVEAAPREARILLAHVLGCTPIEVMTRYDETPADGDRTVFRDLIKRRVDGCPVAYLVGYREFFKLSFDVTPAVLIPRPDTETLLMEAFKHLTGKANPAVLDLCTGSGCVGVSVAHTLRAATVLATDVSVEALEVARRNSAKHGVADRMEFREGDLWAAVPDGRTFDAILTNPPYIAENEFAELAVDVRKHEPRLALDGGPDGLAFYRRIAADAGRFLKPGGVLLAEIGWTQEPAVRELFAAAPGLSVLPSVKDGAGHWRVVGARRPA
jgi:release factor glutamine methyltransferase